MKGQNYSAAAGRLSGAGGISARAQPKTYIPARCNMTSRATIRGWFYTGAEDGYDYLLVVCDDFDYQDFPVFCHRREVLDKLAHHQNQQMSTVMEVYDLHLGMEEQIAQDRAWNIPEMR